MKILVVNAGSSSLKYQLFDMSTNTVLAKGNCERIGIDGIITHKCPGKPDYKINARLFKFATVSETVTYGKYFVNRRNNAFVRVG